MWVLFKESAEKKFTNLSLIAETGEKSKRTVSNMVTGSLRYCSTRLRCQQMLMNVLVDVYFQLSRI